MAPLRAAAAAGSAVALLIACVLFLVGGDSSSGNATVLLSFWPSWGGWGQAQPSPGYVVAPPGTAQLAAPEISRFAKYLAQARLAAKYAAGQPFGYQPSGVVTGSAPMPFWGEHVGAAGAANVLAQPVPAMVPARRAQWTVASQPAAMVRQVVSSPVWRSATMHPVARWDGAMAVRHPQPLQPAMRRYIQQPPPTMSISVTPGKNSSTPAHVVVAHGMGNPFLVKPTVTVQRSDATHDEIAGLTGKLERMDRIDGGEFKILYKKLKKLDTVIETRGEEKGAARRPPVALPDVKDSGVRLWPGNPSKGVVSARDAIGEVRDLLDTSAVLSRYQYVEHPGEEQQSPGEKEESAGGQKRSGEEGS
ncbi:hypothetical protein T484DRAFT_1760200, partial [Baffinella frigidus]